jgi:membrane-bound serine protease (ClpP class)
VRVARMSEGRTWIARLTLVALTVSIGLATAGTARAQDANTPAIVGLRLEGVVDPFLADYIRRGVESANDAGAPAVLIQIDTPGGLASSMREMIQAVLSSRVPVICYVAPEGARAASAGAFVLMSCPVAAMAPGTNVGAATPVGVSGVVLQRKVTQDAIASIRSMAETYGRNADVAESFVRDATSISAEEALEKNVIDLIEPSVEALLADVSGTTVTLGDGSTVTVADLEGVPIDERTLSPGASFLHGLIDPNLAFIFFWLGLGLIILELIVPGHIFSGTIGTILLLISIASFGLLPVRLLGIVLLIAALAFFVVEIAAPGLGIWSIAGLASLVAGGLLLYDGSGGVQVSPVVLILVTAAVGLFFGVVVSKALALRHLPPVPHGADALIGKDGVVIGPGLGPTGVVRIASEEWRATSPAGPLPGGTRVRVTALDGLVLTVEPFSGEHLSASAPAEGGTAP